MGRLLNKGINITGFRIKSGMTRERRFRITGRNDWEEELSSLAEGFSHTIILHSRSSPFLSSSCLTQGSIRPECRITQSARSLFLFNKNSRSANVGLFYADNTIGGEDSFYQLCPCTTIGFLAEGAKASWYSILKGGPIVLFSMHLPDNQHIKQRLNKGIKGVSGELKHHATKWPFRLLMQCIWT